MDRKRRHMANLCPFYLGVAYGDLRLFRSILHNAGGPCKRFLKQSGYRVAATVQIGFILLRARGLLYYRLLALEAFCQGKRDS